MHSSPLIRRVLIILKRSWENVCGIADSALKGDGFRRGLTRPDRVLLRCTTCASTLRRAAGKTMREFPANSASRLDAVLGKSGLLPRALEKLFAVSAGFEPARRVCRVPRPLKSTWRRAKSNPWSIIEKRDTRAEINLSSEASPAVRDTRF